MNFEWDEKKNISNIKKHGISFEEAAQVFGDREVISVPDDEHSHEEERWITIGQTMSQGLIVVVHTERIKGVHEYIRIISARKSTKRENREYFQKTGGVR
ncbi:MAG: BrnT family toxin [bacterium]|nr:BrnT family toxin [bacterium]